MEQALAVRESGGAMVPLSDIERMGTMIATSRLFGVQTPEQAIALMLIAQAEGRHPASAAMDYHIIKGRPSLKADAILGRFQASGGTVEWKTYTDQVVTGIFAHPKGGGVTVTWDDERVKQAQLTGNDMHKKYPRQMKRARCIAEGVRTVFPAVLNGFMVVEEAQDTVNEDVQAGDGRTPPPVFERKPVEAPAEVVETANVAPEQPVEPEQPETVDKMLTAVLTVMREHGSEAEVNAFFRAKKFIDDGQCAIDMEEEYVRKCYANLDPLANRYFPAWLKAEQNRAAKAVTA